MDRQWWSVYLQEVKRTFGGERLSVRNWPDVRSGGAKHPSNSGAGAIAVAAARGAVRIVLLGYDCKYAENGRRHWHGDHPPGTAGNAAPKTVQKWPKEFADLARNLGRIEIINCSRDTALTVFKRARLEDALAWQA